MAPLLQGHVPHGKTKHAWQVLALVCQLTGKLLVKSHLGVSVNAGLRGHVPVVPLEHLREK